MNSGDITGIVIIVLTIGFISYIIYNLVVASRHDKTYRVYDKELKQNRVSFAGSDEVVAQIAEILTSNGQPYSSDQVDRLMFDTTSTWVLYAYGTRGAEDVQAVMITEQTGRNLRIVAYALASSAQSTESTILRDRLIKGVAWQSAQAGDVIDVTVSEELDLPVSDVNLVYKQAYTDYRRSIKTQL